jgi:glucokinase
MDREPAYDNEIALGIDVGGTIIKAGLISRSGVLLDSDNIHTLAREQPEKVVEQILVLISRLCERSEISYGELSGIGVSFAGFITADGVVTATAHLSREWVGYDLGTRLARDLPTKLYFSLDTPAPTLGEAFYGAGKGIPDFAYVTVSTGIGAGIFVDGRYFTGGLGWAGGVGHIIIDEQSPRVCEGCGNHGCLETFAAKQGILETTRETLQRYPDSLILRMAASPDNISPKIVCQAAEHGDPAAQEVFQQAGHALGIGLVALADILAPTRIVVGGGIAQAGDLLLEPARAVVTRQAFPPRIRQVEIVQAALGDLSGIFGAAAMVFYDLRINSPL